MSQEFRCSFSGWLWIGVSQHRNEDVSWDAVIRRHSWGGRIQKAHSPGADYEQRPLLLSTRGLSKHCLSICTTWSLASPRASIPRESEAESTVSFMTQPRKSQLWFLHYPIGYAGQPYSLWEGITHGCEYQETGIIVDHLEHWLPQLLFPLAGSVMLANGRHLIYVGSMKEWRETAQVNSILPD